MLLTCHLSNDLFCTVSDMDTSYEGIRELFGEDVEKLAASNSEDKTKICPERTMSFDRNYRWLDEHLKTIGCTFTVTA